MSANATLTVIAPSSLVTRDEVRDWLIGKLPDELSASSIEVNLEQVEVPTPSVIDEFVKEILTERHAPKLIFTNANDRAMTLIERSIQTRNVKKLVSASTRPKSRFRFW